jgi:hypothetical protein
MDAQALKREAIADVEAATRVSAEDLAVAALVMMPFTLTAVVLLSWIVPLPSLLLQLLWLVVTVAATAWNAGWRERNSSEDVA